MSDPASPPSSDRTADGRFVKGNQGGPGRPRKPAQANVAELDRIGSEVAAELLRVAIDKARGGDSKALELVLNRVWPQQRGRAIQFDLSSVASFQDIVAAHTEVADSVLAGEITAQDAAAIGDVLERQRELVSRRTEAQGLAEVLEFALRRFELPPRQSRPEEE